jgi:heparosan-N-sulfate-glucuronate 5-epimerase
MRVPSSRGGVAAMLHGGPFFEEYPTDPPSFVLNGALYAIWGCRDVAVGLDDTEALALYEEARDVLAANVSQYDLGYWSRYDLFPHPTVNVASLAYHKLHIDQLRAMALLSPGSGFSQVAERFARYRRSPACVTHASVRKVAFRLAVPRTRGTRTAEPMPGRSS